MDFELEIKKAEDDDSADRSGAAAAITAITDSLTCSQTGTGSQFHCLLLLLASVLVLDTSSTKFLSTTASIMTILLS